ncbi:MAG: hypothetical protein WA783_22690 [Phormidesmis sp.]
MSQTTPPDHRELEQLLFDIAEHARDEDYDELYETLLTTELFVSVKSASIAATQNHLKPNKVALADASTPVQIREITGPREDLFMPVATNEDAPILTEGYVKMLWLEALKKALTVKSVAGIKLQGENSWVCFYKPQIEQILSVYAKDAG